LHFFQKNEGGIVVFRLLSAPIYAQWEVTPQCNYDCLHCYNHWKEERNEPDEQPNTQLYEKIVSEIITNQLFSITITGGEPLLVTKLILPYLKKLKKSGVRISINSNASLLNKEIIFEFKKIGVDSFLISLPSADAQTNDYITQRKNSLQLTTNGIRLALEYGLNVTVNMVVTTINKHQVIQTAKYVANLGVKNFSATKATVPGNCHDFSEYALSLVDFRQMLSDLVQVKNSLKLNTDSMEFYPTCAFGDQETRELFGIKRSCSAAKTNCTIGFDGQIRPCSHAPQTYGNINDGLQSAWIAMDEWRGDQWIPEECQNCRIKYRCGGGCKIEALQVNKSLTAPDPNCDFSQLPIPPDETKEISDTFSYSHFKFNHLLKIRQEPFGGILYVGPNNWVPADPKLIKFATDSKEVISNVDELAKSMGISSLEAHRLSNYLLSGSIIQEA